MLKLIAIIKIVAIVQIIVVMGLLLYTYGIKSYFYYKTLYYQRMTERLEDLLRKGIQNPINFTIKSVMRYHRFKLLLVDFIIKFDLEIDVKVTSWHMIRDQIMQSILLPKVAKLGNSRHWENRYMACKILELSPEYKQDTIILNLINDPNPLVSINAAALAVHCNSQTLLDAVVDTFSKGRRVQQSLYAQIVSDANGTIIPLIKKRLQREDDPYIKSCCYRILTHMSARSETLATASIDLDSSNLDLKLAVLTYLAHNDPKVTGPLLQQQLRDKDWQVRAKSAALLGKLHEESSAELLEICLKDPEWWVRINAAEALGKLGVNGIMILKRQLQKDDPYAYDAAMKVLSTFNHVLADHN